MPASYAYGAFVHTRSCQAFFETNGVRHDIPATNRLGDQSIVMKIMGGPRDDGRYKVQVETVLPRTQTGITLTGWVDASELETAIATASQA